MHSYPWQLRKSRFRKVGSVLVKNERRIYVTYGNKYTLFLSLQMLLMFKSDEKRPNCVFQQLHRNSGDLNGKQTVWFENQQ